ncbi:hypothetical protein CTA2_2816 [Colletotrichum tanaceti]|uniref:Uncharacterized protein n=1 Tax=Colletotrichum tanaceti TaxID=1306861 RepID=A0A4U6XMA4_9PEZI|nr:hypothetical protein CTA2_2816 [Colletotrichum tanaceti]TKW56800.1 hypothetical protein CTA1_6865 [Colletotrichum tanaceti]
MPLLYEEGSKAFARQQEEIINETSIFCWSWIESVPADWTSLLAPSPEAFQGYAGVRWKTPTGCGKRP